MIPELWLSVEEEEEIYWSSRESTSNYSESLYDSYDPFSYMAERVGATSVFLNMLMINELKETDISIKKRVLCN